VPPADPGRRGDAVERLGGDLRDPPRARRRVARPDVDDDRECRRGADEEPSAVAGEPRQHCQRDEGDRDEGQADQARERGDPD
jgi:hypothetical protein